MSDLKLRSVADLEAVTFDLLQTETGLIEEDQELATAVAVALGTDRRALPDDVLPDPDDDDRRGFWGDHEAREIWGGWPLGSRLWLVSREKITGTAARQGATLARVEAYVREALQPFIDKGIASRMHIQVGRTELQRIEVVATLYRGPLPAISLEYQAAWDDVGI